MQSIEAVHPRQDAAGELEKNAAPTTTSKASGSEVTEYTTPVTAECTPAPQQVDVSATVGHGVPEEASSSNILDCKPNSELCTGLSRAENEKVSWACLQVFLFDNTHHFEMLKSKSRTA